VDGGEARRIAKNQTIFRDANERIEESVDALELSGETPYLCECGDERCSTALMLTRDEYERVRAEPTRFVIAAGHEIAEAEQVSERNERYWVIEKTGEGREVAEQEHRRA
jgi:hypothetical protein